MTHLWCILVPFGVYFTVSGSPIGFASVYPLDSGLSGGLHALSTF